MRLTPVVSIWSQMRSTHTGACPCVTRTHPCSYARTRTRGRYLIVICPQHAHALPLHPHRHSNLANTSLITRHSSHVTHHTSLITNHSSQITKHESHVTNHSSHVTSCASVDSLNSTTTGTPTHVASVTTPGPAHTDAWAAAAAAAAVKFAVVQCCKWRRVAGAVVGATVGEEGGASPGLQTTTSASCMNMGTLVVKAKEEAL